VRLTSVIARVSSASGDPPGRGLCILISNISGLVIDYERASTTEHKAQRARPKARREKTSHHIVHRAHRVIIKSPWSLCAVLKIADDIHHLGQMELLKYLRVKITTRVTKDTKVKKWASPQKVDRELRRILVFGLELIRR
jgi:hypothetical protein